MSASLHNTPSEGELSELHNIPSKGALSKLHNIPSEGALSELASNEDGVIEEELLQINKVEVKRTKSFGSNSPVLNNRSRRSSGVRVVWRTTPTAELENLNRVLGIPKRARSPSPRAPAPPVDHVFSESFDPLSVHVRPLPDSANSQAVRRSTSVNSTSNLYNTEKRAKRQHSFESSDMTSVKDLRSLFEELVKQRREISDKNAVRRAKTLAGYELLSHEITSRHSNLNCNKNQITQEVKRPIITQEEEKNEEQKLERTNSEKQELPSKIPAVVVEPLPPVKHLRNIFEKNIPNDISTAKGTQELKVTKGRMYNNSESINRDIINNLTDKSSADAEAEPVLEINETIDLKKEEKSKIQKDKTDQKVLVSLDRSTSTSVSNLKAKWEALMNSSEGSYKPKQKKEKNKILKSSQSITSQHSQDMKITITSESSKATSPPMNDYALLQTVKDSNYPETHQPIERTTSLRNSVRNMALLYENRKFEQNMNLGSRSSSTPSITPAKTDSLFVRRVSSLDVSFDSVSSSLSPVTSAKINPIVASKSLENLKQRFTDEDNSNVKEENLTTKENSEISYKEISLGSLERKASVRDLKKKFEDRGNQEEKPQRGNENSNKVCKIQKKEKKDNDDISLKKEEANEIKSVKMNLEKLNNESETIKKSVENETRKDNHENENTYVDNFTNYSTPLAETKLKMENKKNLSKIENLVKEFVESEGLTEFLEISNPPKDQKTNHFENSFLKPMETPPNTSISKTSDIFPTSLDKSSKVSDSPPLLSRKLRSFSTNSINMTSPGKTRELNPDEIKYFETLQSQNSELNVSQSEGRSRSSTVASSTPATTQFSVDTTQKDSPTTSTSTKFRHLHSDELKFFETTGISPKLTKRSSSELSLRHETLDKALRISSPTDEIGRKE